jgi:hypothetical protein
MGDENHATKKTDRRDVTMRWSVFGKKCRADASVFPRFGRHRVNQAVRAFFWVSEGRRPMMLL